MIPIYVRLRVKTLAEFGKLIRHSGEEYTHVLEGQVVLHTEFYDPVVLNAGESVYIDSNMGHAYVAGEKCDEAVVLSVCSAADESLMDSLLNLHGRENGGTPMRIAAPADGAPKAQPASPMKRRTKATGGKRSR
jgi:hypothetical protein